MNVSLTSRNLCSATLSVCCVVSTLSRHLHNCLFSVQKPPPQEAFLDSSRHKSCIIICVRDIQSYSTWFVNVYWYDWLLSVTLIGNTAPTLFSKYTNYIIKSVSRSPEFNFTKIRKMKGNFLKIMLKYYARIITELAKWVWWYSVLPPSVCFLPWPVLWLPWPR